MAEHVIVDNAGLWDKNVSYALNSQKLWKGRFYKANKTTTIGQEPDGTGADDWDEQVGGGNTLDQAYDQGGVGAGRIINVLDGPVKLDQGATPSVTVQSPFNITNRTTIPSTVSEGDIIRYKNEMYVYDSGLAKFVSFETFFLVFGKSTIATSANAINITGLNIVDAVQFFDSGPTLIRASIITDIHVQINNFGTGTAGSGIRLYGGNKKVPSSDGNDETDIIFEQLHPTYDANFHLEINNVNLLLAEGEVLGAAAHSDNSTGFDEDADEMVITLGLKWRAA